MPPDKKYPDILFIPPVSNPVFQEHSDNFIPVGLLVLSGELNQCGFTSSIYRPGKILYHIDDFRNVAAEILSKNPRSVGFSTWCHTFPHAILLAKEIKQLNPDIPVIFGGPQVSIVDRMTIDKFPFIDYVIRGEADKSLPELLNYILNGNGSDPEQIEGLTFRSNTSRNIISNPYRSIPDIMDDLPLPDYKKIFEKKNLRLDVGRGCPFHCTYCSTNDFFSKRYRIKSATRIISEMEYCNEKLNAVSFGFSHDMLTLREDYMYGLCAAIDVHNRKTGKNYTWTCSARTDCVSFNMLKEMWESGCRAIFFGVETGSEKIQQEIKKKLDLEDALKKVAYSTQLGIQTVVSYMVGFPGETPRDLDKTLRSVIKMSLHGAQPQMTHLSILPGTPLYERYLQDLEYDTHTSGFTETLLSDQAAEMISADKSMFSSYYYLPNKNIPRENYLFIANLVNYLFYFIPTLVLIKEKIRRDLNGVDLYKLLISRIPVYSKKEDIRAPELVCLTQGLKEYLEYLYNREDLPDYIWDVFHVDFAKAFMIAMYNNWISYDMQQASPSDIKSIRDHYMIRPTPAWKLVVTEHYIFDYENSPLKYSEQSTFRKGKFAYIVLAATHRYCKVIKLPKKYVDIIGSLKEMTFAEFKKLCSARLDEKTFTRFIKKLVNLKMITVDSED